jgi:hypothetical protein
VPVFLVIVDGDVDELAGLVGVRALCDPLVAFFVGGRPELRERFERFGITCVDVASGEALESAWRRAGIQSRVVRRG